MPRPPAYVRAETLAEATSTLTEYGPDAAVLSGGQSLLPMMSAGLAAPDVLVDVNRVPEADVLQLEPDLLTVGACVRHRRLELANDAVAAAVPTLRPAGRLIAHTAIRNRGTMLGSICHADPAAEWPAVALATDARIVLAAAGGEPREVAAIDFFQGPMTTTREPEELATHVRIPVAPPDTYAAVTELAYRDGDYAVVGVVAQLTLDADRIADCRIALFGVDATPVRARQAELLLTEGGIAELDEAAARARDEVDPISDATASRNYRLSMVPVFTRRAVKQAYQQGSAGAPAL